MNRLARRLWYGRVPGAVLWDMDGTLVDTEPYWIAAEHRIVARHGNGRWTHADALTLVGFDLRDAATELRRRGGVRLAVDDIVEHLLDDVIEQVRAEIPWRPGAQALLAELRQRGVPCALVTMSWRRLVDAVLESLPTGTFTVVVTGDEVAQGKPHPEPYLEAARRVGVEPRHCVALEDSPTGVRSALAAGCKVVGIPNAVALEPRTGLRLVGSLTELSARTLLAPVPAVQRRMLGVGVGVLSLAAVAALVAGGSSSSSPVDIPIDAWAPYWTLDAGADAVRARGGWFREVSPFWYSAEGVTDVGATGGFSEVRRQQFVDLLRSKGIRVVPTVVDALPKGRMAQILIDPDSRARHVAALVELAERDAVDGLDIDYETFAFVDGRSTWATTRPGWVAFVEELGAQLRRRGKMLTVSVPPVYDAGRTGRSGYWVYDYRAIEPHVDRIRVMAYDFSTSEPGPIAPLSYVRRALKGAKEAVRDDSKIVLGIPLYGRSWTIARDGSCPASHDGVDLLTQRWLHEKLAEQGVDARRDPDAGELSFTYGETITDGSATCRVTREVHIVDPDGSLERIELARRARIGGVVLWALGFDDESTWETMAAVTSTSSPRGGS